jgi:3',5'-cyclic AMP phosphodiesterase CpdA
MNCKIGIQFFNDKAGVAILIISTINNMHFTNVAGTLTLIKPDGNLLRNFNLSLREASLIPICFLVFLFMSCDESINKKTLDVKHVTHQHNSVPFAVIGDTQRTSILELLFLFREVNDKERELLLDSLFRVKFDLLVHLGDMVFNGASADDWDYFDRLFEPVMDKRIPIIPAMGNHEYWGNNQQALKSIVSRFPYLKQSRWYTYTYGHVGLIIVDSNKPEYSDSDWRNQLSWFKEVLQTMEEDSSIRAVLVFSHHPPFTNSSVTGDELHVQESFLTDFYLSTKAIAFISGHVHGYERILINGKTFIVSGGGGAPRVHVLEGRKARHEDQFTGPSLRPFNYLLVYPESEELLIEVVGFYKEHTEIQLIDLITIPYQ